MSLSGSILSAIGAAGPLFAGYGTLTLGPVQFFGLAKPKSIAIGGKQSIAMHKLPGGGRVLDAMGPDDADIAWSGYLDGGSAGLTARALDKLRQSGQAVTLAWDVFSYQVVVSDFSCEIQHIPMPYKITCAVISDGSQVIGIPLISLALQVTADLSSATPATTLSAATLSILCGTLSSASIAASAADATTFGSASYTSAVNAVNAAGAAIGSAMTSANTALTSMGTSLSTLSLAAPIAVDTIEMSNEVNAATSACGDLAQLAFADVYVSRAAANLQRASA